jgi:hypothetical protein
MKDNIQLKQNASREVCVTAQLLVLQASVTNYTDLYTQ